MCKDWFFSEGLFEVLKGLFLSIIPKPGGVFANRVNKWTGDFGKVLDKVMVIIGEIKEFSNVLNFLGSGSGTNDIDLFL